jgi:F-type H+-transporting ATPase subunit delta
MTDLDLASAGSGFRIGQVYAQAIFSLATEQKTIDDVKTDLDALMEFADKEESFLDFLASPYFNAQTKNELILKVFSDRLTELVMNFLFVVMKNGRAAYLPFMIDRYGKLWFDNYHCCPVVATVSEPLSVERIRNLSHQIAASIKRNIELRVVVDPSIIGGVIIRYGENVVDNSVRRRLAETVKTIKNYCRERGRIDEI